MANRKKKHKSKKAPQPLFTRLARRYRKWPRRLGITAGLVGVLVAVIYLTDPFGGTPTAIDANGEEVPAGVLEGPRGAAPRMGSVAPNFLLPDFERRAVRLSDFDDKLVFVNFWAGWCTFCDDEMPDILLLAEQFPEDVVVLAVNRGDSTGTAERWVRDRDLPFDLPNFVWLLDEREVIAREYRVDGMPQSFVISRGGVVLSEIRRVTDYDEISQLVEPHIRPEASAATN